MAAADDGYAGARAVMAAKVYRWKLTALKRHIQKLKTNFPITDDMTLRLKELIDQKFANASCDLNRKSFKVSVLLMFIMGVGRVFQVGDEQNVRWKAHIVFCSFFISPLY